MSNSTPEPRPVQILRDYSERYPEAWRFAEQKRKELERPNQDWPKWCYVPRSVAYAVVDHYRGPIQDGRTDPEVLCEISAVSALAAWRMTKGVYVFDETLREHLWHTPAAEKLPIEALYRLPEWCPYIQLPEVVDETGRLLQGAFVHLGADVYSRTPELRYELDLKNERLRPFRLTLAHTTLKECVEATLEEGRLGAESAGNPDAFKDTTPERMRRLLEPLLSLTLYLCSENPELRPAGGDPARRPENPTAKKTKKGERIFAAKNLTQWDVGWRTGPKLRTAWAQSEQETSNADTSPGEEDSARSSPRAHIRRAHWHSFWSGPRDDSERQHLVLRWMPPIPVNVDNEDDLPATIRPVEE